MEPRSKDDLPVELVAKNLFREQKRLHKEGIPTEITIRYGDPVAEILSFGNVQNADLVALSTHGRTGLERVRYGSVAESILRKGKFPMLFVRTAGKFIPDPVHAPAIRAERRRKQLATTGSTKEGRPTDPDSASGSGKVPGIGGRLIWASPWVIVLERPEVSSDSRRDHALRIRVRFCLGIGTG